jgi:hypothetical protein
MKISQSALRLNELFGCGFDYRANVKMKSSGVGSTSEIPISIHLCGLLQVEPGEYLQISTSPSR